MHTRYNYKGRDQVYNASGSGMTIAHIGHSILHSPHHPLHLRNILHVPSASKNLLFAHKIALDNDVFIEFHFLFLFINNQATGQTLFRGPCHGGLYPLIPTLAKTSKHAFITPQAVTIHLASSSRPSIHLHLLLNKFLGKINLSNHLK
jgi:hypothetical protein